MESVYIPYCIDDKLNLNDLEFILREDITIITNHPINSRCLTIDDLNKTYDYIGFCDFMRSIQIKKIDCDENIDIYTLTNYLLIGFYCKNKRVYCNETNKTIISILDNPTIINNLSILEGKLIYHDMTLKEITKLIYKYAFSGGCDTKEEQERKGADLNKDESFKIISKYGDEEIIKYVINNYGSGGGNYPKILTGEVKKICANLIFKLFESIKK